MKYAFVDSNGVLVAHGHIDSHGQDVRVEVGFDFDEVPREWKWDGNKWERIDAKGGPPLHPKLPAMDGLDSRTTRTQELQLCRGQRKKY
ncbi:hypothetical protein ACOTHJ_07750 [Achromobacter xylosoxidans]|uniref:hypothetical protein n=1 Tax=Alcaligenes xylosoxydans xylosoxydans TaxID=85698 RepID=UPI0011B5BBEA|nr:hypothetical protein [Achromobacter xylosoxidans]